MSTIRTAAFILAATIATTGASQAFALNPQPLPPGAHHQPPGGKIGTSSGGITTQSSPQWGGFFSSKPGAFEPPDPCLRASCRHM